MSDYVHAETSVLEDRRWLVDKATHISAHESGERPLTIVEAKKGLGLFLGVDPANITITVEA